MGNVVTETTASAVDYDDEAQMIAQRVAALQQETNWDLPIENGEQLRGVALQEWILNKENSAAQIAIEKGIAYGLLKRELGHGAFEGWLKDHGLLPRTVRDAMQSAKLLMALSDSNRRRASELPKRKLTVLATATPAVIDGLFDDGSLDDIDDMNREQVREVIKLNKIIDKQEEREARLNDVIAGQDNELRQHQALPEAHAHVAELRRAVLEETEALRVNAHQLQSVMDRAVMLPQDIAQSDIDSILHPLMYALQGLCATATALHSKGFELFADFKPDVDVLPPQLSEQEVAWAKRLVTRFDDDAQMRDKLRQVDLAPIRKGAKA